MTNSFEPKQYNSSPSTWLVREYEHAVALGARRDVNIVIWDRPELRQAHLDQFNDQGSLDSWKFAAGGHKRYVSRDIRLDEKGVPVSFKVDHEELINQVRARAPSLMWDNLCATTRLICPLTGQDNVKGRPFTQQKGADLIPTSTTNYHHHRSSTPGASELTAHVSLTDAGIRLILNNTAQDLQAITGRHDNFEDSDIPAGAEFYDSTAGQILLFKPHVLHKTSPLGKEHGRHSEAVYAPYFKDVEFSL